MQPQSPQSKDTIDYATTGQDDQDQDIDEQPQSNYKAQVKKYASYKMDDQDGHFLDDYLYRQLLYSGSLFFFSVLAVGRMFTYASTPDCGMYTVYKRKRNAYNQSSKRLS